MSEMLGQCGYVFLLMNGLIILEALLPLQKFVHIFSALVAVVSFLIQS